MKLRCIKIAAERPHTDPRLGDQHPERSANRGRRLEVVPAEFVISTLAARAQVSDADYREALEVTIERFGRVLKHSGGFAYEFTEVGTVTGDEYARAGQADCCFEAPHHGACADEDAQRRHGPEGDV